MLVNLIILQKLLKNFIFIILISHNFEKKTKQEKLKYKKLSSREIIHLNKK